MYYLCLLLCIASTLVAGAVMLAAFTEPTFIPAVVAWYAAAGLFFFDATLFELAEMRLC